MPKERQVSFSGGELSPTLWGRTDLEKYMKGARNVTNWIVTPQGSLSNRPGTQMAYGQAYNEEQRIISWVFSETDNFVLLMRDGLVGVFELDGSDPGYSQLSLVQTLVSPWTTSELFEVQFAQFGNSMILVHGNHAPREIYRKSDDTWTIETFSFNVRTTNSSFFPLVPTVQVHTSPSEDGDSFTYTDADGDDQTVRLRYPFLNLVSPLPENGWAARIQRSEPRQWSWQVTRVVRDDRDGKLHETMPVTITKAVTEDGYPPDGPLLDFSDNEISVYPDWSQLLDVRYEEDDTDGDSVEGVGESGKNPSGTLVETRVYRGRSGRYGFIGATGDRYFRDDGAEPDFANPPPQGFNPYLTENPRTVAYFQGRLWFGGTAEKPMDARGSALDNFSNFDEVIPADDLDAVEFRIASNKVEQIRAIVPKRALVMLTSSGEWVVTGSGLGNVISPNSVSAQRVGEWGTSDSVSPENAGDHLFFVQANRTLPRVMFFGEGGAQSIELSIYSNHLFDGYTIKDWAYARDPFSVLWVVRSDGALLSLTFVPEQKMLAWCKHEISGASVQSVCTKPEGTEDAVYLVTKRRVTGSKTDLWYVERLSYSNVPSLKYKIHMDATVSHNGRAADSSVTEDASATLFLTDINVVTETLTAPTLDGQQTTFSILDDMDSTEQLTNVDLDGVTQVEGIDWRFVDNGDEVPVQIKMTTAPAATSTLTLTISQGSSGDNIEIEFDTTEGATTRVGKYLQIDAPDGGEPYLFYLVSRSGKKYVAQVIDRSVYEDIWGETIEPENWYFCADRVGGLSHINGDEVSVFYDGQVGTGVVDSGSVTLKDVTGEDDIWAGVIHVGLPYNSDFDSLAAAGEPGREKVVSDVMIELAHARGAHVGSSLDRLVEVKSREVDDDYNEMGMKRIKEEIIIRDKWGREGYVSVRQSDPVPCLILGITRSIEYGG